MLVAKQIVGAEERHDALTQSITHNGSGTVSSLHKKRAVALAAAVGALMSGAFLTVTALGRRLNSPARTKHNIKRIDRLLSNIHLKGERLQAHQTLLALISTANEA